MASIPRPVEFGSPHHCAECFEHNETLLRHTPDSISMTELGNPGWDPICYLISIDEFKYYLPALARLSLGTGDDYYLVQFLFHLNSERIAALTNEERTAIAIFLEELIENMAAEIEQNLDTDDLLSRLSELRSCEEEQ